MGKIIIAEQVAPSSPGANKVSLYAKAGGKLYKKNDEGSESQLIEIVSFLDATLSGTPIILSTVIDGNTYYSKWYPIKT